MLAFGPMLVRLSDVSPMASAFWRMAIAAPVLLAICAVRKRRAFVPSLRSLPVAPVLLAAAFFSADVAAWHLGILRTTAANATLFGNCAAFFLAAWGICVWKERPSRSTSRSLLLAMAGAALLLATSAELSPRHLTGDLLCLLAAGFYTGYLLAIIGLRRRFHALTVITAITLLCAIMLLPAALAAPGPFLPHNWLWPVVLAVSSQLLGQGLLVFASGQLPPALLGLGLFVQPLVSALSGWLAFGERMGPLELAGALLIAVALALVRR